MRVEVDDFIAIPLIYLVRTRTCVRGLYLLAGGGGLGAGVTGRRLTFGGDYKQATAGNC